MKSLLSVIVPCFNSEKYIERCISSILNQTYKNLEIIVIDDGSTDGSAYIVNELKNLDDRVKYYYQENSGVSAARNKGLSLAKGDYITFVDSDDSIQCEMYKTLIELLNENSADISHCSYQRISSDGKIKKIGGSGVISIMDNKEGILSFLYGKTFSPGVWNKIFTANIINSLYFDLNFKINEDILFSFFAFNIAKKTVFIDECFYEYHNEETSSCVNTRIVKKTEDQYFVSKKINEAIIDVDAKKISQKKYDEKELMLYRVYVLYGDRKQKNKAKGIRKSIIKKLSDNKFSGNAKFNAIIIKWIPFLYRPIYYVYNKLRKPNWDLLEEDT